MQDLESRLSILETRFEHCQVNIDKLMEDIKEDHKEFKVALKDISTQLRHAGNDHANAVLEMRKDVLETVKAEYERKSDIQRQLTDMRLSIGKDIDSERKRITTTLWIILSVLTITVSFFGWLYVNVLPHGVNP